MTVEMAAGDFCSESIKERCCQSETVQEMPEQERDMTIDFKDGEEVVSVSQNETTKYKLNLYVQANFMDATSLIESSTKDPVKNRRERSPVTGNSHSCDTCEGYVKVAFYDTSMNHVLSADLFSTNCSIVTHQENHTQGNYYTYNHENLDCQLDVELDVDPKNIKYTKLIAMNGLSLLVKGFYYSFTQQNTVSMPRLGATAYTTSGEVTTVSRSLDTYLCIYNDVVGINKGEKTTETGSGENDTKVDNEIVKETYSHQCNNDGNWIEGTPYHYYLNKTFQMY